MFLNTHRCVRPLVPAPRTAPSMRSCSRPRRQHRPATRGCGQRCVTKTDKGLQQRAMGCVMQQLGLLPPGAWSDRADAWRAITPSRPRGPLQEVCSCASPLLSTARWFLPCTLSPHVRQLHAQATHPASNTVACFCMLQFLFPLLQDPSAIQAAHSSAPLPEEFNAMAFLSAKGKGKPVAGV